MTLQLVEPKSSIGIIDILYYNGYKHINDTSIDVIKLDIENILYKQQLENYYNMYFIEINEEDKTYNVYSKTLKKSTLRKLKLDKLIDVKSK